MFIQPDHCAHQNVILISYVPVSTHLASLQYYSIVIPFSTKLFSILTLLLTHLCVCVGGNKFIQILWWPGYRGTKNLMYLRSGTGSGTISMIKCLNGFKMILKHPYFLHEQNYIDKGTWANSIKTPDTLEIIVLLKAKVGGNFKVQGTQTHKILSNASRHFLNRITLAVLSEWLGWNEA